MKIAKIVTSNSHIDYVARVIDALDSDSPPEAEDYCFGQFVGLSGKTEDVVGVIYDSRLVNPEYGSFGPRLSPRPALGNFSPDYLNEQGILIGILLLGVVDRSGKVTHGVPRRIVPPGQEVEKIDADAVKRFHSGADSRVHLHYYSQVVANAGQFAIPLLDSIIDQLCANCTEPEIQRLKVLKQSLMWQGTFGGMKL
ncbi:MAG TPA: hypothetical protein VFZ23_18460 [Pyrinomonadaceae bacterium]